MKFESWYAYLGDSASTTGDDTKIIESLVNYCATFLCILLEVFVCVCVHDSCVIRLIEHNRNEKLSQFNRLEYGGKRLLDH